MVSKIFKKGAKAVLKGKLDKKKLKNIKIKRGKRNDKII